MKNNQRKIFASLLLVGLIVLTFSPILFLPQRAEAQVLSVDLPHIAAQVANFIKTFATRAWDIMDKIGGATIYRNALNSFLSHAASESATWIASGGKEGQPLFFTSGDYWAKMGDSMAADYLDKIAKDFTGQGVCEPIDATVKLNILLSLPVPKPSPAPFDYESNCSLSDIKENILNVKKSEIFQFSLELDQNGSYNKFSTQLGTMIDAGNFVSYFSILKENFDINLKTIKEYTNNAKQIFDQAQASSSFTQNQFLQLRAEFGMDALENEIEIETKQFKDAVASFTGVIKSCENLSRGDFCPRESCINFCQLLEKPGCADSETIFQNCLDRLKTQKKFLVELDSAMDDVYINYVKTKEGMAMGLVSGPVDPNQAMKDFEKATSGDNPISTIITLSDYIKSDINQKTEESKFLQLLRGEWKTPTTLISDEALTASGILDENARELVKAGTASSQVYTGVAVADAIGTFTQTLFSKLQKNILQGFSNLTGGENKISFNSKTWEELFQKAGQKPPAGGSGNATTPGDLAGGTVSESPIQGMKPDELKAIYSDVLSTPLKKGEDIRLIDEFSKCPSDPRYALPNNCVVDTSFSRAVEQEMTIAEAMEKNYLHGEWYVSASGSHAGNIDTKKDFSNRYSLTNATILAQAGIMPLGFQIAADEISRNSDLASKKFTLKEIVDSFYDIKSSFYKLVNPQWRLKDFPAQCDLVGYSSIPEPRSSERQETCLQWRTCTGEKDDGTCHTWNYCTAYKNKWRFNADTCQAQYDSCQTYTRATDKTKFNWLENTLNKNCDASGVGCQWYCQSYDKNLGNTESWDCAAPNKKSVYAYCNLANRCNNSAGCACTSGTKHCTVADGLSSCVYEISQVDDVGNTIFLNRLAETCSAGSQGCTEFIRTKENLGTNLLANASFETYQEILSVGSASGWNFSGDETAQPVGKFISDESKAMVGKVFAQFNQAGYLYPSSQAPNIDLLDGTKYAISFYAKNDNNASRILTFSINGTTISKVWTLSANSSWQLLLYEFTLPVDNKTIKDIRLASGVNGINGDNVSIDYLKLEVGKASSYQDYGTVNLSYFKKAPDYLSCYNRTNTGSLIAKDNDVACLNFVQACNKEEVGCEKYTPANGDPYIPAVAKDSDTCPAECAGFDNFKERATDFYPDRDVALIPRTASVCSASEVGCEGYTNLEAVGRGGEGREFYSYVRACQKPDGSCGNFYTWVGSETSGFELKRYTLRKNIDGSPTEILSSTQAEAVWGKCEGAEDARNNPNCKELYSENGSEIYYRLYKNTIACNGACLQLRKNKPVSASACWPALFQNNDPTKNQPLIDGLSFNTVGGENCEVKIGQQTCSTTKGEVCDLGKVCGTNSPGYGQNNPSECTCSTGVCTITTLPEESIKCSSANEGCREYKGNDANNIRVSFMDDFENGTYYPWQPLSFSEANYSNDSIYFGGHSINIKPSEAQSPGELLGATRAVNGLIYANKFYLLSFLIKGGVNDQTISIKFLPSNISFSNVIARNDWQVITIGPVYFNKVPDANEKIQITSDRTFWLDNIQLKDTGSLYLIKNSWQTPSTCGLDTLGCLEYRDSANQTKYFKSFSQICSESVIGCEALINTHNSASAFSEKFNIDSSSINDDVTIPADQMEYLVYNKDFSCTSTDKGCQKLGLPNLTESGQVTTWSDVLLKNNPDDYIRKPILCQEKDQGCEEFTSSGGGVAYLKDPGAKECEWKDKFVVGSETKTGWFKKGTDQPCYDNYYFPVGSTIQGIKMSDNLTYDGYAGVCPSNAVGCRRFIDPLSTSGYLYPGQQQGQGDSLINGTSTSTIGGAYYYLDNYKINKSACNGKISLEKGCVLLDDGLGGDYLYNAIATYDKSQYLNGELITPISCDKSVSISCTPSNLTNNGEIINNGENDYCKYCVANNQTKNDTNLIIKVDPTRVCSEWLNCKSKTKIWQKEVNDYIEVCNETERCQQQTGEGEGADCVSVVIPKNEPLDITKYKARNVSWFGIEPGGYSLYNWRPIDLLTTKVASVNGIQNQLLLTSYIAGETPKSCTNNNGCPDPKICYQGKCLDTEVGVSEETCDNCPAGSFCQGDGKCIVALTPQAFPEKDSPFSSQLASTFESINTCDLGINETNNNFSYFSCQNSYRKSEYGAGGSTKKYFNTLASNWPGVCISVSKETNSNLYVGQCCDMNQATSQCNSDQPGGRSIVPGKCTSLKSGVTNDPCFLPANQNRDSCTSEVLKNICSWEPQPCGARGQCEILNRDTTYYAKNNFCVSQDFSSPDFSNLKTCLLWYPSAHLLIPSVETVGSTIHMDGTYYANLQGNLSNFGASSSATGYFQYRQQGESDWTNKPPKENPRSLDIGPFNNDTDELAANTPYEFRVVAQNSNGISYGAIKSFATSANPSFTFELDSNIVSGETTPGANPPLFVDNAFTVNKSNPGPEIKPVSFSINISNIGGLPFSSGLGNGSGDINVITNPSPSCQNYPCLVDLTISVGSGVKLGRYTIKITAHSDNPYLSKDFTYVLAVGGTCVADTGCWSNEECQRLGQTFTCTNPNPQLGTCSSNSGFRCKDSSGCPPADCGICGTYYGLHRCWIMQGTNPIRQGPSSCNHQYCMLGQACPMANDDCKGTILVGGCTVPNACLVDEDCPKTHHCNVQ